jgi:hypothetical protein
MNINTQQTNNMDFTDALSSMITPNNSKPTQFKQKKPPTKKISSNKSKTTKPKTTQKNNKLNTNNNKQTSKKNKLTTKPTNPNQLTKKETDTLNKVNNTTPPKQKTKQQSQKDFKKAQLESNNKNRPTLFKNVLENINEEKTENNLPIMTLQRFTTITNSLMKIFNDMNYLITDTDTIYDLLTDKMDKITDTIKDKSINTQRKIITDIITILNSNPNTQLKDIRKYEYYRKKLQLDNKVNQSKQIDNQTDMNDNQPNPKT